MTKQKEQAIEKKPLTDEEMAVNHNHKEIVSQLNKHFNGTEVEKKNAMKNVGVAFDNLTKIKK